MITPELIETIRLGLISQMAADRLLQEEHSSESIIAHLFGAILLDKHGDLTITKNTHPSTVEISIRVTIPQTRFVLAPSDNP